MSEKDKIKINGEVFTPGYVVDMMLNIAGYHGEEILEKHVIDNSSGTGMFLERIVREYASAYFSKYGTYDGLKGHLEKYVHGIEISRKNVELSIQRLNIQLKSDYNVDSISRNMDSRMNWDIRCANTLEVCDEYYGKMDYVFANPPYVRIHNVRDFDRGILQSFSFSNGGMTDLYLAFFEIGFRMMSENGKLCYISPSSWYRSVAGREMRKYIFESGETTLRSIADFKHFQPFSGITTYVSISLFDREIGGKQLVYEVNETGMSLNYDENLKIRVDGKFNNVSIFSENDLVIPDKKRSDNLIKVKNGFATLADKIFISDGFNFTGGTIDVIKAQTDKWYKCIFPYDTETLGPLTEEDLCLYYPSVYDYLKENFTELYNRSIDNPLENWYLFGRTQAINDLNQYKISIQSLVKDVNDIKFTLVEPGKGVYGGLYIVSEDDSIPTEKLFEILKEKLRTDEFMGYIKSLRHYKSGGYYTLNSKELENYINYMVYNKKEENR